MKSLNCIVDPKAITYEIDGKLYYTYDKKHYEPVEARFSELEPFCEGLAPVSVDRKWGYISLDGEIALPPQYDGCKGFQNGVAVVYNQKPRGNLWEIYRLIDRNGNALTSWEDYYGSYLSEEGLRRIQIDGKWGFADLNGNIIIKPQYEFCLDFTEGLAAVEVEPKKWGYIDSTGTIVIAPNYTAARHFTNGVAPVAKNKTLSYIDRNGLKTNPHPREKDEFQITLFTVRPDFTEFKYSIICENDKMGVVDSDGNIVLEPLFEDAKMLHEKIVGIQWNGKWDIIFLP